MPVFSRVVNLEHQLQIPQDVPKGDKASKKQLGLKPSYQFLGSLLPSICETWQGTSDCTLTEAAPAARARPISWYSAFLSQFLSDKKGISP